MSAPIRSSLEIATDWYDVGCVHRSIIAGTRPIPDDHQSEEFAKWLTEQYRMSMAKGIQIGRELSKNEDE